jgi:tetratricopeptide (TPR) repeat protein
MADIGLNQNISIKGRQFHLQTSSNVEEGFLRTEVYEKGRLLYSESTKYERRDFGKDDGAELRIRRMLDQYHHNIISSLESLFELSNILEQVLHGTSHHRIGAIFLSILLFDKAEKHLLKAIDLNPENHSSYILLGRCYFFQRRFQQAGQTLEPLINAHLEFPDLYNLLGLIFMEQKNFHHALEHFRHAIKLNPYYIEAYYNLAINVLRRIVFLKMQNKFEGIKKSLEFFKIILEKIRKIGNVEDKDLIVQVQNDLLEKNYGKVQTLLYDFRNRHYYKPIPQDLVGFEFYLWLKYLPDRLDYESLCRFKDRISETVVKYPDYPDLWNYLALIHLMFCRDFFLKGLDNFKEATKINPNFSKAKKNLRLVENDGREFLSLVKAIVKD